MENRFTCPECGKKRLEKFKVFENSDWCQDCYDKECKRSIAQDIVGVKQLPHPLGQVGLRSRPPKYVLTPDEYKKFGY